MKKILKKVNNFITQVLFEMKYLGIKDQITFHARKLYSKTIFRVKHLLVKERMVKNIRKKIKETKKDDDKNPR